MINKIKCLIYGHDWDEKRKIGTQLRVQDHHYIKEGYIYMHECTRCGKFEFRNSTGRIIK